MSNLFLLVYLSASLFMLVSSLKAKNGIFPAHSSQLINKWLPLYFSPHGMVLTEWRLSTRVPGPLACSLPGTQALRHSEGAAPSVPILIKDCGSFGSPLRILALWDFGRLCSTFLYSPAHSAPSSLVPSVCQVLLRKLIVVCLVSPPTLKAPQRQRLSATII